jgi:3-phenylpropionate/trans-cinnamate dioxygenase ferredoxin subunit
LSATVPGCYQYDRGRTLVRCPWHGWEFDLATGQSWFDPKRERVRSYPVSIEPGRALLAPPDPRPGPYVAETVRVSVEDDYVVIEL